MIERPKIERSPWFIAEFPSLVFCFEDKWSRQGRTNGRSEEETIFQAFLAGLPVDKKLQRYVYIYKGSNIRYS